ncbi:hypothetical protein D0Z00_000666 [Geotrichum galactomycetum]|uniref:Uncharacterized protein n=1 Tax=Geotrichum galactomycetum TaxID=27317 RepID=A0ACB6V959_9ASCO|nr:hypothetical protein D0Z00_000666 [Geotrichum candidum]
MTLLSTLSTLAPYHLLAYSLLFGATTYQSFFSGLVAFKTLPYNHFSALQARVFPTYFSGQTVLSFFLLFTRPIDFADSAQLACLTLVVSGITGLTNLSVMSPLTRRIMEARRKQEGIDGKSCKDPNPSDEMRALNKSFGKIHGISVLLNLAGFISLILYGIILSGHLVSA